MSAAAIAVPDAGFGTIHVRAEGAGEPVLLLHGVATSSDAFASQLAGLRADFSLLAWDAPGYGRSTEPPRPLGLEDFAAAALQVLDMLGHPVAHVAGVSWGGLVATRLALLHPSRVRTLALIGSTFGRAANGSARLNLDRRARALERDGIERWAAQRVPRLVSPAASADVRTSVAETIAAAVRVPGFSAAARTLATTDHRSRLGEIAAPTLVVAGAADEVTGVKEAEVLARGIPGARLHVVPAGGHLVNQECPEAVNALLRQHWTVNPIMEQRDEHN